MAAMHLRRKALQLSKGRVFLISFSVPRELSVKGSFSSSSRMRTVVLCLVTTRGNASWEFRTSNTWLGFVVATFSTEFKTARSVSTTRKVKNHWGHRFIERWMGGLMSTARQKPRHAFGSKLP